MYPGIIKQGKTTCLIIDPGPGSVREQHFAGRRRSGVKYDRQWPIAYSGVCNHDHRILHLRYFRRDRQSG